MTAADWIEAKLLDADGTPLKLEPWQREAMEARLSGRPVNDVDPRGPEKARVARAFGVPLYLVDPSANPGLRDRFLITYWRIVGRLRGCE